MQRREIEEAMKIEYLKKKRKIEEDMDGRREIEEIVEKENIITKRPQTSREHLDLRKALISK